MPALAPLEAKPERLTEVVYNVIHRAIVDRAFAPGERVTEAGIAERLNVSKTPVREALLRLREVGLIEPDGGRGNRVVGASPEVFREAYELREVLENFTAAAAAERATPAQVEKIVEFANRSLECARRHDVDGFRDNDRLFHEAIADAAGNKRATQVIADASNLIRALRERDLPQVETITECGSAHQRIASAVRDSNPTAAGDEMLAHLRYMAEYVLHQPAPEAKTSAR